MLDILIVSLAYSLFIIVFIVEIGYILTYCIYVISDCDCDRRGTVGGSSVCDSDSGMCICKPFAYTRRCETCTPGTYNLQQYNIVGCEGEK